MTEHSSEEMLSAYLDGELTVDERAQVDRQLADSAELRQLLEDLQTLRSGLKSLPQYQLEDDFADRVLRRAEQAMLSEARVGDDHRMVAAAAAAPIATPAPASEPSLAGATVDRWKKGGVRVWGWAAAAIAAGLVIMLFEQHPVVEDKPAAVPIPGGGDARWIAGDTPVGTSVTDIAAHEASPAAKAGPLEAGTPAETGIAGKGDVAATAPPTAGKGGAGAMPLGAAATSPSATPGTPPLNSLAADEKVNRAKKAGEPAFDAARQAAEPAVDNTLVVIATVTREAQRDRKFDQLLNQRQIVVEEEHLNAPDVAKSEPAAPSRPMMKESGAGKSIDVARDERKASSAVDRDVDAVVVDATANELSSVMSELNNKSEWFPSVEVAPESPMQAPWTAYNRGQVAPAGLGDKQKAGEADKIANLKDRALPGAASPPGSESAAASQAPAPQIQAPGDVGNRAGNLQQQSRARRVMVPTQAGEERGNQAAQNFAAQNAAQVDAMKNLSRSITGSGNELNRQRSDQGNLPLNQGNLGADGNLGDGGPRVRALFLLRVVDTPAASTAPAAGQEPVSPAGQGPVTK